jgi:hypothetical protein
MDSGAVRSHVYFRDKLDGTAAIFHGLGID